MSKKEKKGSNTRWFEDWLSAKSPIIRRALLDVERFGGGLTYVRLVCAMEGWDCKLERGQVVIYR